MEFWPSFDTLDSRITGWMARYGIPLLRLSLGLIFFWFGVLKFFPGLSPAQELASKTLNIMTFGLVPSNIALNILAAWECAIGLGLLFGIMMRTTLFLLFMQMLGTITPIFFFPHEVFLRIPYAPTLEGQYIIKNLVLISGGLVVGATVRGGRLITDRK
jgi:uncharacterized membrane protein YphA (DoxX/SURF4 family)